MSERGWTSPQRDAITARGGQVLVSAAAGSGKTAVLVERAVSLLCDPECPVDADRLLIVTFSRAAAAEMKQRMGKRLAAMIAQTPGDLRLLRQQALLPSAQVSTVDAFCMELVRQNFQELEISPDFSIADQSELAILRSDCVRDAIGRCYEEKRSDAFLELVELLSTSRGDARLADTILQIYDFSRSHPFFEEWLDKKLAMYDSSRPVGETVWGEAILKHARESVAYCLELEKEALDIISGNEKMEKAYQTALQTDVGQLERLDGLAKTGDWDGLVEALAFFSFERLGALRGDDAQKAQVQAARNRVKKLVQNLAEKYLNATAAQFREDLDDLRPKIEVLFELVRDFTARIDRTKADRKRLDFADVEHLALRLLVEKTENDYGPTARAGKIAEQYDYVLVDEYQDTNAVQDMIFSCVSKQQANLFLVGDVKQSIYRFRQAMPEIFMEKKNKFFPYRAGTGNYPAKIMLDTNFRSRREVTEAVNAIFTLIMSDEMGEVDYNEEESLKYGATYPTYGRARPELLLTGAQGEGENRSTEEIEAGKIARKILELLDSGYLVEDGGETRPVTLRDFCILMRSPKGRAEAYVKELGRHGIAASAENAGGFLAAREISAVMSLLRALDNPLLDIELVAAMLSPLFEFDADDITRIRLAGRGIPFFSALNLAAGDGDEKASHFLKRFHRLRAQAGVLSADRLLLTIYDETSALEVFRAMRMGAARKANLELLMEYAAEYHALGYKQLGGFVGFLGRLSERQGDLASAGGFGEGANVVRVMSIHRSKGLEFPVVFLADTMRQFNKTDLRQNTMLHSRFGFACVRRDHAAMKQFATVPLQAVRLESQRSMLSEEMRILYVALTRAKEKLMISGVIRSDLQKKLNSLSHPLQEGRLPSYIVGDGNCYADWILSALLHHASCEPLRELARRSGTELIDDGNPWNVSISAPAEDMPLAGAEESPPPAIQAADPRLLAQLRMRAAWRYPYEQETKLPTKLAVSDLAKGERNVRHRFAARPKFLTPQRLTPSERGNAMHKFMQFADYGSARNDLEREIGRMASEKYLSEIEAESLQIERLRKFFASDVADRIFKSGKVYRELRFAAECGKDILGESMPGLGASKIVLQGVADCVFVEDGGAVILDYKTDEVPSPEVLRERYRTQLELYRAILSRSVDMPVKECLLYSFHLSAIVHLT